MCFVFVINIYVVVFLFNFCSSIWCNRKVLFKWPCCGRPIAQKSTENSILFAWLWKAWRPLTLCMIVKALKRPWQLPAIIRKRTAEAGGMETTIRCCFPSGKTGSNTKFSGRLVLQSHFHSMYICMRSHLIFDCLIYIFVILFDWLCFCRLFQWMMMMKLICYSVKWREWNAVCFCFCCFVFEWILVVFYMGHIMG